MAGAPSPATPAAPHVLSDSSGLGTAISTLATAGGASGGQGPTAIPPAEATRLAAPKIVDAIASSSGPGRVEIQLDPPELGRVEILIEMRDQILRATVVTERHAVGEMMRRHADILLTQLQDSGFADVDLRFGRNDSGARWGGQGHSGRQGGSAHYPADGTFETATARRASSVPRDGLDLRF